MENLDIILITLIFAVLIFHKPLGSLFIYKIKPFFKKLFEKND